MHILRAAPFDRPIPAFLGLPTEDQSKLSREWLALSAVIDQHVRRIKRHGPQTPLTADKALEARDVREHHARPWPVDPILFGIREVLLFADVATSDVIDPSAYMAAWRFDTGAVEDLGALAIYTELPSPRLVFFWRGTWTEALERLSKSAVNEVEFAALVTRAQQVLARAGA